MACRQMEAGVLKPERARKVTPFRVFTAAPRVLVSRHLWQRVLADTSSVLLWRGEAGNWEIQTRTK